MIQDTRLAKLSILEFLALVNRGITIALGLLCLFIAGTSIFYLSSVEAFNNAKARLDIDGDFPTTVKAELALEEIIRISEKPLATAEAKALAARVFSRAAESTSSDDIRIAHYCEALSSFGHAIRRRPLRSAYLVSWANIRQLLVEFNCPQKFTDGDYREVLELGIASDPTNATVLFAAALIYNQAGERTAALEQMKKYHTLKVSPSESARDFSLSLVVNPEDLFKIVPPRFPQTLNWSAWFMRSRPADFLQFSGAFAELQEKALLNFIEEYDQGRVSERLFEENHLRLLALSASTRIRQQADKQLAGFYSDLRARGEAEYFNSRSVLADLEIIRSSQAGDTRPKRAPFVRWGAVNDTVYLDSFHQSLGFYLAPNQTAQLIELVGPSKSSLKRKSNLKLYGSHDNLKWEEVGYKSLKTVDAGAVAFIGIQPEPSEFNYWKVNFNSSARDNSFKNSLGRIINVYGLSTRTKIED